MSDFICMSVSQSENERRQQQGSMAAASASSHKQQRQQATDCVWSAVVRSKSMELNWTELTLPQLASLSALHLRRLHSRAPQKKKAEKNNSNRNWKTQTRRPATRPLAINWTLVSGCLALPSELGWVSRFVYLFAAFQKLLLPCAVCFGGWSHTIKTQLNAKLLTHVLYVNYCITLLVRLSASLLFAATGDGLTRRMRNILAKSIGEKRSRGEWWCRPWLSLLYLFSFMHCKKILQES